MKGSPFSPDRNAPTRPFCESRTNLPNPSPTPSGGKNWATSRQQPKPHTQKIAPARLVDMKSLLATLLFLGVAIIIAPVLSAPAAAGGSAAPPAAAAFAPDTTGLYERRGEIKYTVEYYQQWTPKGNREKALVRPKQIAKSNPTAQVLAQSLDTPAWTTLLLPM